MSTLASVSANHLQNRRRKRRDFTCIVLHRRCRAPAATATGCTGSVRLLLLAAAANHPPGSGNQVQGPWQFAVCAPAPIRSTGSAGSLLMTNTAKLKLSRPSDREKPRMDRTRNGKGVAGRNKSIENVASFFFPFHEMHVNF